LLSSSGPLMLRKSLYSSSNPPSISGAWGHVLTLDVERAPLQVVLRTI
jgi:hypothetical protein